MAKDYSGIDSQYFWVTTLAVDANSAAVATASTTTSQIKDVTVVSDIAFVPNTSTYVIKDNNRVERSLHLSGSTTDITVEVVANDEDVFQSAIYSATVPIQGFLIKKTKKILATGKDSYIVIQGSLFGFSLTDPNADVTRLTFTLAARGKPRHLVAA